MTAAPAPTSSRRAAALALLLLARALGVGALSLLLSWGLEIAFAPLGALALLACAATAGAAVYVALVKVLGLPRARAGLVFDQRFLQELPVAALVAFCWIGLAMLTLSATGLGALAAAKDLPHPAMLASGFAACVGLAAFLQLTQSSVVVALDGAGPIRPLTLALPSGVAVVSLLPLLPSLTSLPSSSLGTVSAVIALVNAALLSLSTTLLFAREDRREHAIPIGFQAGWLFVLVFVTGSPVLGLPHALGLLTWPSAASVMTGGAAGFEAGLVCTFVLAILAGALVRARSLPPDGAPIDDAPPESRRPDDAPPDDRTLPPRS